MLKFLAQAGLTLTLALTAVGTTATVASAQDLQLRIGPDGIRPVVPGRDDDRRDRRDSRRDECSPREALSIARDEGLRRAEVTRVTRRSLTVEGMTRRGPTRMVFANVRGCPEI
ncbi:MAG: hypothetical protein ACK4N1_16085 [Pseudorhizobium sp.]